MKYIIHDGNKYQMPPDEIKIHKAPDEFIMGVKFTGLGKIITFVFGDQEISDDFMMVPDVISVSRSVIAFMDDPDCNEIEFKKIFIEYSESAVAVRKSSESIKKLKELNNQQNRYFFGIGWFK